jgi:hypothetical protein
MEAHAHILEREAVRTVLRITGADSELLFEEF